MALPSSVVVKALGVSRAYANEIRKGRLPHPRHWLALAGLFGNMMIPVQSRAT